MSSIAITIENLGKKYIISHQTPERYTALRDVIANKAKKMTQNILSPFRKIESDSSKEEFWALKDVSFEVNQGEVIGIIGRNGSGKTTLLKILSRITEPTAGRFRIKGRVSSLLEVGTGFHPELTGRENVFLNGTILGMRRAEIGRKFDEIIDFSGVEKFIDTPVKRYSSGMQVRLAFAVAAHLEPEILLIDEVLAVGDVEFQKKCLGKMKDVAGEGRTVLFVSHNMAAVNNLCRCGVVLEQGQIVFQGDAGDAVRFYLEHLGQMDAGDKRDGLVSFPLDDTKPIQLRQVSMEDTAGQVKSTFEYLDSPFVNIVFDIRAPNPDYYAGLWVQDIYGTWVFFTADDDFDKAPIAGLNCGEYCYRVQLPNRLLKPGRYYLTISLTQKHKVGGQAYDRRESVMDFEIVDYQTNRGANSGYRLPAVVAPEIPWTLMTPPMCQ